jgi:uncharacterized glyoxalase superfamily protein PhnB
MPAQAATIIPALRYRDAQAAIDFLCRAFGFSEHLVVPGPDDTIAHAELRLGNSMVMLGSAADTEYGRLTRLASESGGPSMGLYVVVPDADAHCARAKEAGAEIVMPLKTQDYGGRDYTCRDLEGNLWTFGTYDPWRQQA